MVWASALNEEGRRLDSRASTFPDFFFSVGLFAVRESI